MSNVDLALLYQTRRCLFVEGKKDVDILPRIVERLGYDLFVGSEQLVPFEIGGVGKARLVRELVRLFERMIGASLRWGVVRDSDANVPAVKEAMRQQASDLGFPVFHLWERYSIENYLIDPPLLLEAIRALAPDVLLDEGEIRETLSDVVDSLEEEVDATFVSNTQIAFRDVLKEGQWHQDGAGAAVKHLKSIKSLEDRLAAYPGRRIFGRFVEAIQAKYGVHVRLDDVVGILTKENCPEELLDCLEAVASI